VSETRSWIYCHAIHFGSTSDPWSPVVDELQPPVSCSCGMSLKPAVTCIFGSRQFSSLHAVFGAHVPSMCPGIGFR